MSRAGKKKRQSNEIPQQPEAVADLAARLREQKAMNVYGTLAFKLRGGIIPIPELHGAMIADNVMNQIMQQMIVAQSQIVVPRRGKMVMPK